MAYSKDVLDLNPELTASSTTVSPSKYKNVRTESFGMTFDSGHEAGEIGKLILADKNKAGVFGLRLQVRFPLPGHSDYVADATYLDDKLQGHVVDAKGVKTPLYRLKRKLFKEKYGQEIEEL